MNQELIDIALQRGRLIERSSMQRQLLAQQLQPIGKLLHTTDRTLSTVHKGVDYVRQHPELLAVIVVVLIVLNPSRVWRGAKSGLSAWRIWRMLRRELFALGLSSRP